MNQQDAEMLRRAVTCIAMTLAAVGAPRTGAAQQAPGTAVAEGARVYGATCGRCHNPRSPLERSDREWVVIVNHMRVRGNLTGGQARQVLAFLQATNSDPGQRIPLSEASNRGTRAQGANDRPPSTDPGVLASGRTLTTEKACLGCHVVAGSGGQVGPALDGVVKRRGPAYLRQKLADPTFDNATSMMPNLGLSDEEIEAILAYLATLGRP